MRLVTGFVSLLRRVHADQDGQSLVIVSLSMAVMLGMSALAIDVASWYTKHHQTQVVADSAALAAANCLAHPNAGPSGASCTSNTDVTDATSVAVAYAAANGVKITASQVVVDTSNDKVTVNPTASTPAMFASVFGVKNTAEAATATASYKQPPGQTCGDPGQNCDFMFANNHDSTPGSYALNVSVQGNSSIYGGIQTNGNLNASATGNAGGIYGTGLYGPGGGSTTTGGNKDPWKSQPADPRARIHHLADRLQLRLPSLRGQRRGPCGRYRATRATAQTWASTSRSVTHRRPPADIPESGNIYCAIGNTPGSLIPIRAHGPARSRYLKRGWQPNTFDDTFVGGSVSYSGAGGDTLAPCGYTASGFSSASCSGPPAPSTANYPLFYVIGADQASPCVLSTQNSAGSCALNVHSNRQSHARRRHVRAQRHRRAHVPGQPVGR